MSVTFLVTSLIIIISPGIGVVYTVSTGLARGRAASVVAAFGCTLGIVPQLAAAAFGLAALLYTSAVAFQTLKYAGVVYLLYLAWNALREHGSLEMSPDRTEASALKIVRTAILINILNPKLSIFFFAFLPQFVSPHEPSPVLRMIELSLIFMLLTFIVFGCYGVLAASVRQHVLSRPRFMTWLRRAFAGAFVALGVKLAFSER
jgi:threonine/homoserine/homoserine lactone efflux protein